MANNYNPDLPPTLQPAGGEVQGAQGEWLPLEPGDPGYMGTGNSNNGGGASFDNSDLSGANDLVSAFQNLDFMSTTFLLGNVGAPFVIGLAVGYFAKKVLKIALFLAGGAIVLLFVTEYYGMTTLSDNGLQSAANAATNIAKESGGFLMDRLSRISTKGVSAVVGFLVGLKFG